MSLFPYEPRRASRSRFIGIRGITQHLLTWGDPSMVDADHPPLVMLHGWMDVAASFQFVVDAMARERYVIALDWRGFGQSDTPPVDAFWFPDYLGDLEATLDSLVPGQVVDLLGHSMGGNVAMLYAGIRPARLRKLVNLEGFGMPDIKPAAVPKRYAMWLDQLKDPMLLRPYDSVDEVAERLLKNNPLLRPERAAWLAPHWSRRGEDGRWVILGAPAHKRVNAVPYRADEVIECWKAITAPVLWVEGDGTNIDRWWGKRYPRAEFEQRIAVVARIERQVLSPAGHMLHHDQPEMLARRIEAFLDDVAAPG